MRLVPPTARFDRKISSVENQANFARKLEIVLNYGIIFRDSRVKARRPFVEMFFVHEIWTE